MPDEKRGRALSYENQKLDSFSAIVTSRIIFPKSGGIVSNASLGDTRRCIDGKIRLIVENNLPEYIAEDVIRALDSSDLEQIAEEEAVCGENYTFKKTVENWKKVL